MRAPVLHEEAAMNERSRVALKGVRRSTLEAGGITHGAFAHYGLPVCLMSTSRSRVKQ
jgi:hypothetical protein